LRKKHLSNEGVVWGNLGGKKNSGGGSSWREGKNGAGEGSRGWTDFSERAQKDREASLALKKLKKKSAEPAIFFGWGNRNAY